MSIDSLQRAQKPGPGGLFITFEGIDGCGKGTQVQMLEKRLLANGIEPIVTREPGGTILGEELRRILMRHGQSMSWTAELLLMEAARAQHVVELIVPALGAGRVILCDRYLDSTTAFQGFGRGICMPDVEAANLLGSRGVAPDVTLIFDLEPEEAQRRIAEASRSVSESRFDSEELSFHRNVRDGFLELARLNQDRCRIIDASKPPETVHAYVMFALEGALKRYADKTDQRHQKPGVEGAGGGRRPGAEPGMLRENHPKQAPRPRSVSE